MRYLICNAFHGLQVFLVSIFRVLDALIISLHRHLSILPGLYLNGINVWLQHPVIFSEAVRYREWLYVADAVWEITLE